MRPHLMFAAFGFSTVILVPQTQAAEWSIPASANMAWDPSDGPEPPENEMTAVATSAGYRITMAQLIRTALVSRFIFSGSNCSSQLSRLAFEVEIPNMPNPKEQAEKIREAAEPGVNIVQKLCGFEDVKTQVFEGNFLQTFEELTDREARHQELLKVWDKKQAQPRRRRESEN